MEPAAGLTMHGKGASLHICTDGPVFRYDQIQRFTEPF
jgi:NAD(P)H-flavin reductase